MKNVLVLLCLLCLVACGKSSTTSVGDGTYIVSGTVTSGSGTVSGVTVSLTGTSSGTATTDADGKYSFTGVNSGIYQVSAAKAGYITTPAAISVTVSSSDVSGKDFAVVPANYNITGSVKVKDTGTALSGVDVTLTGTSLIGATSVTVKTDSDGNYTLPVTAGSYSITAALSGYDISGKLDLVVSNGDVAGQDFSAVLTLQLSSLTPSSATVVFGNNLNLVAALSVAATSDTDIVLSSNNAGVVVPAKVTVLAGSSSVQFSVTANGSGDVVITGTLNGKNAVAQIHVRTAVCGNGIIEPGEQCDDGNKTSDDGCSSTCTLEQGFACSGSPIICLKTVCGDKKVEGSEQCDDGNLMAGDGCSATCKIEAAVGTCGDGIRRVNEECNDGNKTNGDGCSSACKIEAGWSCSGTVGFSSVCNTSCGDGVVAGSEQCDTGTNNGSGTGCRSNCTVEPDWACYNLVGSGSFCAMSVL